MPMKTKTTPEQLAKMASKIAASILAGDTTAYNIINRDLTVLAEAYATGSEAPMELTSKRVARIAAKVMKGDITRATITDADLKAMAASCLTQSPHRPKGDTR
jgi:hypothetical protein